MLQKKPMKAYLIQHGQAVSEEIDPSRPLSEKGQKEVKKLAQFLQGLNIKISVILHSGKTRAAQTATILSPHVTSAEGIRETQGLSPKDPVGPWVDFLNTAQDDVTIVGHLPFLSQLASQLLGSKGECIAFQQGGMVCLEKNSPHKWRIQWMVVPELLS